MADVDTVLGVDIGTSAIKAALLVKGANGYAAKILAIEPVPLTDSSGNAAGVPEIQDALEKLVARHGLRGSRCALNACGDDVAPRYFSFPAMDEAQLDKAIQFEARDVIPFNLDEALTDWQLLPPDPDAPPDQPSKTEVVYVAARRDYINIRFDMAKAVGLNPIIVDVDGLALVNSFIQAGGGNPPQKSTLLMNIGHKFTNLAVITPSGRAFIRDLAVGGDRLTKAIQDLYHISPEDSEKLKTGGVLGEPNTKENLAKLTPDLRTLLGDGVGELVNQVRDTIGFFTSQRYFNTIDEVWVTGGAANFPGLPDYLAETFNIPATGWNPLADIALNMVEEGKNPGRAEALGPCFSIALGLAMRPDVG